MTLRRDPDGLYRSPLLGECAWLEHGFGTAHAAPCSSPVTLKQIHSTRVLHVSECCAGVEGDALMAGEPGVFVGVKTADCLPLLIADAGRHVVAAVHAGWRGTVAGIAAEAVAQLGKRFGSRPADLRVAIGPSIRECCFEVGPEVAAEFRGLFPERTDLNRKTRIDLAEANRRVLLRAGVVESGIATGAPCTRCQADEFHSWRRDGAKCGRMLSAIGVSGDEKRA